MSFLVDTNILLRSADPGHFLREVANEATKTLSQRGEILYIMSQNLTEFWSVYTRHIDRNGMGHTPAEAQRELKRLKQLFPLLEDIPSIHREWERLVSDYKIEGIKVYDARLVTAMLIHKSTHVLTFDDRDFSRY